MAQDTPLFVLTSSTGFGFSTSSFSGLRFGKSANYASQDIMNRSSGVISFSHSNNVTMSVAFHLMAFDKANFNTSTVESITLGFFALAYPISPGVDGPPVCNITIGDGGLVSSTRTWVCTNVDPDLTS